MVLAERLNGIHDINQVFEFLNDNCCKDELHTMFENEAKLHSIDIMACIPEFREEAEKCINVENEKSDMAIYMDLGYVDTMNDILTMACLFKAVYENLPKDFVEWTKSVKSTATHLRNTK